MELVILAQMTYKLTNWYPTTTSSKINPWNCTMRRGQKMLTSWKESSMAHKIIIDAPPSSLMDSNVNPN